MRPEIVFALAASFGTVAGAEHGTPEEAKAMLAKAAEHYNAVGRTAAFVDFNGRKAPFFDRDLYVFCIGRDGLTLANGGFPSYVGTSVDAVKDADGVPLGSRLLEAATDGGGSVAYRWINPMTHKVEAKVSFVRKLGDDVCGVGAYDSGS